MDLKQYLQQRSSLEIIEPKKRYLCTTCVQPEYGCYCKDIQKVDCNISFVILIHPIEVRRRIATGRMSHLILEDSYLISGQDYTQNELVNQLIADPEYQSVILYPGVNSKNLSDMSFEQKSEMLTSPKKLRVFVIDGTWATAKKTIRHSQNLKGLPQICFTPDKKSNFRVRKQPADYCYSTIEAIHHTIGLIGQTQGFDTNLGAHNRLLEVFNGMVERQLECTRWYQEHPEQATY